MPTIRDLFHKIGNKHNKISISSGVLREYLKREPPVELSEDQLKERSIKLISSLDEIEKAALKADKLLNELRKVVYGLVDPDKDVSNDSK
jgi:hypothetical protein